MAGGRFEVQVRRARRWHHEGTCRTEDAAARFAADFGPARARVRRLELAPMLAFQMGLISWAEYQAALL